MNDARSANIWRLLGLPGVLWLLLLFAAPVLILVVASFSGTDLVGRPMWAEWNGGAYAEILHPQYVPVILRTLGYTLTAVLVCLILGYVAAFTISRYGGRYKAPLILLLLMPWLVNYLIRIYAWLQIFSSEGPLTSAVRFVAGNESITLLGSPLVVVTGLVYNFIPFMILPIFVALESLDQSQVEACLDLYGSRIHVFWFAVLPASLPGVLSGSTLVFLLAFGDFVTVDILGGPRQYMVGNLIQDQFSGMGALPFGAALTACVLVFILVILGLFGRLSSKANAALEA